MARQKMVTSLFVLIAVLAVSGALVVLSSRQTHQHNQQEPAKAENRNSQQSQIGADNTNRQHSSEGNQEKKWYSTLIERPTDWLLVLFNGLLVVTTVALFLSAEKSADAAKQSAEAAEKAVASAESNAQRQLRAYLHFEQMRIGVARDRSGHEVFVFTPVFKNFGNTPANVIKTILSTRPVTDGKVEAVEWPKDLEGANQNVFIAPGLTAPLNDLEVPLKDAQRLGEKYRLVYRFYVKYLTVFNDLGSRETAQVIEIITRGDPAQALGGVQPSEIFRFRPHAKGSFAN